MANVWKYSTLPSESRIGMVREGNRDVYENEIARSMDVIETRKKMGLDITDQKNWIDTVCYNYNLYNAKKMGIDAVNVNKTGYADTLLGENGAKGKRSGKHITTVTSKGNINYTAKRLLAEYYDKVYEAGKGVEYVKEWLLNNGIDENSEDGKKYIAEFEKELADVTEKYRKEYLSKIKDAVKN